MAGMMTDVRKVSAGAVVALVIAVLFADPSGVGGKVVQQHAGAEEAAASTLAPLRATVAGASSWHTMDDPQSEVPPVVRPDPPVPQDISESPQILPPGPTGPDFPPERRHRPGG